MFKDNDRGVATDMIGVKSADVNIDIPAPAPATPPTPPAAPAVSTTPAGVVSGKDITASFKRRKSTFPKAINDVINAQGFDGNPRIVSHSEFEKIINNPSHTAPLLFRTFSGKTKAEADKFDKMLRDGEWYVDCGTGGAQYGQGMYCAGVYEKKTDRRFSTRLAGAIEEMKHYISHNRLKGSRYPVVRRMTLDPSAQIIKRDDVLKEYTSRLLADDGAMIKQIASNAGLSSDWVKKYTEMMKETNVWAKIHDPGTRAGDFSIYGTSRIDSMMKECTEIAVRDGMSRAKAESISNNFADCRKPANDRGVMAAKMGYDAINAVGHGSSGSYTVVLNRTKVIMDDDRFSV